MMKRLFCMLCCWWAVSSYASDIYITPDSSLTEAMRKAREMRRLGQANEVTIHQIGRAHV